MMQNSSEKAICACDSSSRHYNLGLLILRVSLGIIFVHQGWMHLANITATISFFGKLGLAPFMAYVVGIIELLGGLLVIVGMWTRLAALGFVAVMLGVLFTVPGKGGYLNGHDYEFALAGASLALAVLGSGAYAIHAFCKCNSAKATGKCAKWCAWCSGSTCDCSVKIDKTEKDTPKTL